MGRERRQGGETMKLLLLRSQKEYTFSRPAFELWAKFELLNEEQAIFDKYKPTNALLAADEPVAKRRKWLLSLFSGVFLAGIIGVGLLFWRGNPFLALLGFLVGCPLLSLCIFSQIREDIMIYDILTGRQFRCKSVVTLLEKEKAITDIASQFREFLEVMKTWGGTEVVAIELGQEPTRRVLEARHAV
jgi:hypothetical protein